MFNLRLHYNFIQYYFDVLKNNCIVIIYYLRTAMLYRCFLYANP